jgi:hypothetical protein
MTYHNVEVKCIGPSRSVSVPWFNIIWESGTAGNTNWGERLSKIDLVIEVACFFK